MPALILALSVCVCIAAEPAIAAPIASKKVELPGAAEHVCVGGGGRFLLVSLPKQRQIAVFDAKEQRIVKYLPVAEDAFLVAAGMEHAYVLLAESRILQRYSLKTFAREWAKPSPLDEAVDGMAMGSASAGPLALVRKNFDRMNPMPGAGGNVVFFDPVTLKAIEAEKPANTKEAQQRANMMMGRGLNASSFFVRASADGRLFTWRESSGGEGHSMGIVEFVGGKPRFQGMYAGAQLYLPAPNSRFIYSTDGVMTDRFKSILQPEQNAVRKVFLPAASGTLFMQLAPPEEKPDPNDPYRGMRNHNPHEPKVISGTVKFFYSGGLKSFAAMEKIDGLEMETYQYGNARSRLMYDQRVHLLPDHGILVTLTEKNDQLVVYPFDMDKLLDGTGEKYLLFTSEPPGAVTRGTALSYTIQVKAKAGGTTLKLDSGPPGMTLDGGVLKWSVPADLADTEAAVVLSATDKDGQERFQSFRVRLTGGTVPEPAPMPAPVEKKALPPGKMSGLEEPEKDRVPLPDRGKK